MPSYKPVGWRNESYRHYLASKGIHTRRYNYVPTYAVGDMSLIAGDALGTVGASAVSLAPAVVPVALLYGGAVYLKRRKKKKGSYFVEKWYADDAHRIVDDLLEKEGILKKSEAEREQAYRDTVKLLHEQNEKIPEGASLPYLEERARRLGESLGWEKHYKIRNEEFDRFEKKRIRDPDTGLVFEWNGAHTVNVSDESGVNFDAFSVGSFSSDKVAPEKFKEGVDMYLKENRYEEYKKDPDIARRWEEIRTKRALGSVKR